MMLQYLDIGIAIGVVMLAVSLIITVLVQLVSNVLSLRGSNLRWAVTTLIGQVHSGHVSLAEDIADAVLTHPLISDSTLSKFSGKGWLPGRLIGRWSLANAVRLEELVGVLEILSVAAAPAPVPTPALQNAMKDIAAAAKGRMGPQIQAVATQASELVTGLAAAAATAGAATGWATGTINVDHLLEKVPGAAETVFGKDIKSWFNSMMDRATQRFTLHMRIVTIGLSIVMAVVLHLDAFQLFSDLSESPELRASLVAEAGSMERLAGDILADQKKAAERQTADADKAAAANPPGTGTKTAPAAGAGAAPDCAAVHVPEAYASAIRALQSRKAEAAKVSKADAANQADAARQADAVNQSDARLLTEVAASLPPGTTFPDRARGVTWLQDELVRRATAQHVADPTARLIPEYESTLDCLLQTDTDKLLDRASSVRSALTKTRYRLIPDPYPGLRFWSWRLREIFGILFSAGLLGLGAPFWFNALKSMTALRPILASKQEKETKPA